MNMLRKRFPCKLIALSLCVILLSGCGVAENNAVGEDGIVFTDALNRRVSVKNGIHRAAALLGSFAEVWQLSGGEVCAASEDAWEDLCLELPGCINIGGAHSPGEEAILSSEPPLVLASASTASHVKMLPVLENAGITVAYFDVDSFNDYLEMLDICTDITGKKDMYEKNGLQVKERIEDITDEFEKKKLSEEKKRILLLRVSSGAVKAKGSEGTILGEMLSDFGCINIADSDKMLLENLSVESIIKMNPYRIFTVSMGDEEKAMANLSHMLEENPAWASVEAVKEKRFHIMERRMFNLKPNGKWDKAYEKLSKILLGK